MTRARINGATVLAERKPKGSRDFDAVAALALPWYFGSASSGHSAAGDAGLRSSLGGQIDALKASRTFRGGGILEDRAVDSGRIEDAVHQRLDDCDRIARVRARLSACTPDDQAVLRLHFGTSALAFAVSGVALLTNAARVLVRRFPVEHKIKLFVSDTALCGCPACQEQPITKAPTVVVRVSGPELTREGLNAALRASQKAAGASGWQSVEDEAQARLRPAVARYEGSWIARSRRRETGW